MAHMMANLLSKDTSYMYVFLLEDTEMASSSGDRCFPNNLNELPLDFETRVAQEIEDVEGRLSKHRWASEPSSSVYAGVGGYVLSILSLWNYRRDSHLLLLRGLELLQTAISDPASKCRRRVSFLEGLPGLLAVRCVFLHRLSQIGHLSGSEAAEGIADSFRQIQTIAAEALHLPSSECEVLYGRSGFIYSVMFVRSFGLDVPSDLQRLSNQLAQQIIEEGCTHGSPEDLPLYYEWHDKGYLGAAHGLAGILLCLSLHFHSNNNNNISPPPNCRRELMTATLRAVIDKYSFNDGNVRSSLTSDSNRLVQWCHGAPGFVPVLLEWHRMCAVDTSYDGYYLRAAERCGTKIWKDGLLTKGLGLCHGIAGNGLCLLLLHRDTQQPHWLQKAQRFAWFGIQHRKQLQDKPDRPFSLFEGLSGHLWFLTQLSTDHPFFPGSELLPT
eukprot:GHVS01068402.1.p2 GENE.GHVS01068402.1~~GHVS01068402.1.p2  ORF type:complete len:441 (+),score=73.03 GHVS01068402.1:1087-2409(+)